jgi:hypothetical protein
VEVVERQQKKNKKKKAKGLSAFMDGGNDDSKAAFASYK